MTDGIFLAALREKPNDDVTRLIYADWLEESDNPLSRARAGFIRADCELAALPKKDARRKPLRKKRRKLARQLDADWLAVVSKLPIEECEFRFQCPLRWENLQPVAGVETLRFCETCQKNVYYCDTIDEARDHVWEGHCVAVDARLVRKKCDLDREDELMGLLDEEAFNELEDIRDEAEEMIADQDLEAED